MLRAPRLALLATLFLLGCAGAAAGHSPAASTTPSGQASYQAIADLPDCPAAECTDPAPRMPNWTCVDGRRGGPACKRFPDRGCRWTVVRCPRARR